MCPRKAKRSASERNRPMSALVLGKDVDFDHISIDRYGRLVAIVQVDGTDAGLELIKQGLCWVYEKYVGQASVEIQSRYRDAQHAAQAERAGPGKTLTGTAMTWRKGEK
jgi:endonuclease YncB( thermonuclease family)